MYIVKKTRGVKAGSAVGVGELVPKDFLVGLPFWADLARDEQTAVERETKGLAAEMANQVMSRFRTGEHLLSLQAVLQGRFRAYLGGLRFSYRTAYRYMELVKIIRKGGSSGNGGGSLGISETVVRIAAARGVDLVGHTPARPFGPYTEPIKKLGPPPKDEAGIPGWIEAVETERQALPRKGRRKAAIGPDARMIRAFREASGQWGQVGAGRRGAWAVKLVGILMAEFGLPKGSVAPEAVPEGFRAVLGRPRREVGAA